MAQMFNPPHPGLTLRDDVLPALGLSVTEAAEQLQISRVTLSRVINGNAAITAPMACRLEKWLGKDNGGDAQFWLRMQLNYDLWQAKKGVHSALAGIRRVKISRRSKVPTRDAAARDERFALAS